jgi:hypothetical protein
MPLKKKETEEAQQKLENIIAKYRGGTSNREIRLNISGEDFAEIEAVYNSLTTTYKLEFSTLAEAYRKNRITLERNARRLANIQSKESDEVVKALRDKKNDIEQKIKDTDEQLRQNHVKTGELKLTLESLNKQIKELSRKVSVDDADEEKDKVASELIGELDTFLFSLKETKKSSLELRIRNALNTLMHKEDFIGRVEVELEDDSMDIKLYSPDGFEIDKMLRKPLDPVNVHLQRAGVEGRKRIGGHVILVPDDVDPGVLRIQKRWQMAPGHEVDLPDPRCKGRDRPEPVFQKPPLPVAVGIGGAGHLPAVLLLLREPGRVRPVDPGDDKIYGIPRCLSAHVTPPEICQKNSYGTQPLEDPVIL